MSDEWEELMRTLDVPFFFWVCPKGCRGRVCWHHAEDGGARAECLECGQWSDFYPARVNLQKNQ